jgi:hypothetical protein
MSPEREVAVEYRSGKTASAIGSENVRPRKRIFM